MKNLQEMYNWGLKMNYYDRSLDALMHAYGRYNVTFDHGDGIHLYDVNQKNILISFQELVLILLAIIIQLM